jgi:hypothetical protein
MVKHYTAATVFVNHYSQLGYIHLQYNLTLAETVRAKQAFEAYSATYGVRIQHYHVDNGCFTNNAF